MNPFNYFVNLTARHLSTCFTNFCIRGLQLHNMTLLSMLFHIYSFITWKEDHSPHGNVGNLWNYEQK